MTAAEHDLFALLDRLGLAHATHRHAPVFTVAESRELRGQLPGCHVKNLFLKDKRGRYALVTAAEEQPVNLRALSAAPELGLDRLSFASPERLLAVLGVIPGAVTPFALINAQGRADLTVVLDRQIMNHPAVYAHPLHNAASTAIAPADLLTFIRHCGYDPAILALDAL